MLKKLNKPFISLVFLLTVYNFFFWKESLGLNIVIFSVLTVGCILWINPAAIKSRNVLITIGAVIYCSAMVLINNSGFSKFTLICSLMVFAGFAHQPEMKSLFASLFTYLSSHLMIPVVILEGYANTSKSNKVLRFFYNAIKLGVIPVVVFFLFYGLYSIASPKFSFYATNVFNEINDFIVKIFKDYPFVRFMFILLGFILLAGVLYNKNIKFFQRYDLLFLNRLSRNKTNKLVWLNNNEKYVPVLKKFNLFTPGMHSLLTEHKIGIILLVLVNILILALNIVDIKFLWLNFDPSEIPVFQDYVHEGTYILIFSIVLSMMILLYIFRGNLNFYKRNRSIKILSLAWIFQNAFMALSVGLRDYNYIIYLHTISYKKIGVMIYLLLVMIGLVTMILKINQKRTTYNILKINSWVVFTVFLLMSTFNWDTNIVEYNLANPQKNGVDFSYLLNLNDDVLPYIDKNKDLLKDIVIKEKWNQTIYAIDLFNTKKKAFLNEQEGYSWLSWNLADYGVYKYFENSNSKE